jgi:hypothetical protein
MDSKRELSPLGPRIFIGIKNIQRKDKKLLSRFTIIGRPIIEK